jgi:hypothetical protein
MDDNKTQAPPVEDCGSLTADGTCAHPANKTEECNTDACPLLDLQRRLARMFEDSRLTQTPG